MQDQLGQDLLAGLIKSRSRVNVSVGPAATLDAWILHVTRSLSVRLRRADVSRALPLVYANVVAEQIGIAPDKD